MALIAPPLAGALAPYLALWWSRSARVRAGARRLAATGCATPWRSRERLAPRLDS